MSETTKDPRAGAYGYHADRLDDASREVRLEIAGRVKAARVATGISQAKMAEALAVPLGTYRRWETGESPIPADVLVRIGSELGVGATGLMLGAGGKGAA